MTRNKYSRKHYKYVDYDVVSKIIGKKLRDVRESKDMTINMISRSCQINRNTISRIENGSAGAELQNVIKLAVALDIPLHELFSEVDYFCSKGVLFNGKDERALG